MLATINQSDSIATDSAGGGTTVDTCFWWKTRRHRIKTTPSYCLVGSGGRSAQKSMMTTKTKRRERARRKSSRTEFSQSTSSCRLGESNIRLSSSVAMANSLIALSFVFRDGRETISAPELNDFS